MAGTVMVESHGVSVDVDPANFEDPRFTYCLSKVADEHVAGERKLVYYGRMLDVLFGEDGAYDVMCRLAEANGDTVTPELFNEFYADVMEQVGAKN